MADSFTTTSQPHAVVVGGTRGLGLATVKVLAREGYRVSAIGRSIPAGALGEGVKFYAGDICNDASVAAALAALAAEQGPIRYLVFTQRYRGGGDPWAGEMETTVNATRRVIEAAAAHLATEGDRAVTAVGSVYGTFVGDGQPAGYHVAKAALEQLVRHYAFAWGPRGVRANIVAPCTYLKDESRGHVESNLPLMDVFGKLVPLGRIGTAEDTAEVIAWLSSAKAGYVTGQTITVDGGLSLVWPETPARRIAGV
jgi:NAD(P)-dependent dehydrogenase (short-subunit alcohol dehydrogenase family)